MSEIMNVPNDTGAVAEVNAPVMVTLYDREGESIRVEASKVDYWAKRGFSPVKRDLDKLAQEIDVLGDDIGASWLAYLAACREKGAIDQAAQEVARMHLEAFCNACNELHLGIHAEFAPEQPVEPAAEA